MTLDVVRESIALKVAVTMGERRDPLANLSASIDPRRNLVQRLGILGVDLDPRLAAAVPVVRVTRGVLVVSTAAAALDSLEGGLAPGDVVYAVNRRAITGLAELRAATDGLASGNPVVLEVERGGELIYLSFMVD